MSTYRFKIRNDNKFITGGTINPMKYTAHTGNQQFNEYLTIQYKATTPYTIPRNRALVSNVTPEENESDSVNFQFASLDNDALPLKAQELRDNKRFLPEVSSGQTINTRLNYKNIVIPLETSFQTVDYGDDINNFIKEEEQKAINPILDYERVKYTSIPYPSIDLKFRFYNKDSTQYDDNNLTGGYNLAGFDKNKINKKNNFKKIFFKLYTCSKVKNQNLNSVGFFG